MGGDNVFDGAIEIRLVRRRRRWNRHTEATQKRMEAIVEYLDAKTFGVLSQQVRVPGLAFEAVHGFTQVVDRLVVEENSGDVVDDGLEGTA
jgi:hypothetical protein